MMFYSQKRSMIHRFTLIQPEPTAWSQFDPEAGANTAADVLRRTSASAAHTQLISFLFRFGMWSEENPF